MKVWQATGSNGSRQPVGVDLVVARDDPDLARLFEADLGRAGDVAGRVKRDGDSTDAAPLAEADRLERDRAEAVGDDRGGGRGGEVGGVTGAGMVGMAVGDERAGNRPPGVDVEIACGAIEAPVGEGEEGSARHGANLVRPARQVTPPGHRGGRRGRGSCPGVPGGRGRGAQGLGDCPTSRPAHCDGGFPPSGWPD